MGPSLPLPLGEVAERSEDGEGTRCPKTLSVTFGDSSPSGRAKGLLQAGGADLASKKFLQIRIANAGKGAIIETGKLIGGFSSHGLAP